MSSGISGAIGDDIFGFLSLLSKRQGQYDSTAQQAGGQPSVPEPAPQPPPVPPALPFAVPEPTSRRTVQPPQAGPAPDMPAPGAKPVGAMGPANAPGGFFIPPGPDDTANKPAIDAVPAKGGGSPATAVPAATAIAAAAGEDPGADMMKILQEQEKRARVDALIDAMTKSGMLGAAVFAKPEMKSVLSSHAGQLGGTGAGGAGGGALSFDNLMKLRTLTESTKNRASTLRAMPGIAKRLGVPLEQLETIYTNKPEEYAQLVSAMSKPDMQVSVMKDGRFQVFNKNDPERTTQIIGNQDELALSEERRQNEQLDVNKGQLKVSEEKGAREAEMQPFEIAAKKAGTGKVLTETEALEAQAAQRKQLTEAVNDPLVSKSIADQMGIDTQTLKVLHSTGKLDEVLQKHLEGTSDYQEWLKTDRKMSPTEWFKFKEQQRSPQISPFNLVATEDIKKTNEKIAAADVASKSIPTSAEKARMIQEGKGFYGAAFGSSGFKQAAGWWADVFGGDASRVTDAQTLDSMIKLQMAEKAKMLGTQPTNYDEKLLLSALGGDTTNTREAALAMAKAETRYSLRAMIGANEAIEKAAKNYRDLDPKSVSILESNLRKIPDHIDQAFPQAETGAFLRLAAGPKRDLAIQDFDNKFGPGTAAYVLSHRDPMRKP